MSQTRTVRFRIKRQDGPKAQPYWQTFDVPYEENMNVIIALLRIRENPVTVEGQRTTPVVWECACLEEVCGSCSMLINGRPRQSCSALVKDFEQPITLEPLSKFPVVRDLMVDRSRLFRDLKKVRAWIKIDGTYDTGWGPRESQEDQQIRYELSRCMSCTLCMESCPQYNDHSPFVGPAVISQVRLFNNHPTGRMQAGERLEQLLDDSGINTCGNAQNCVQVCPKEIPLTESIGAVGRQMTMYSLKKLFGFK
ncbi:MAG: succinate dehydrogenase iron-sulfur subunit [Candidatus Sumerlaeia bacterium]